MQYVTEYDVTNISDTRPRKNMITMAKVDTSDSMMIITWAINISFQSPELKWVSWTHTTPYILMTKVIERTSSMLDLPPQAKLYRRLQIFNDCEHSCIMMIMGGSKMSKTEYDLKAICILPTTYPKNCAILGGDYNIQQPRLPPINAGRSVRQFKGPLAWPKWRTGSPLVRYCFLVRGDASSWGVHRPWRRDSTICWQNGETSLTGTLRRKNVQVKTYMLGVNRQ